METKLKVEPAVGQTWRGASGWFYTLVALAPDGIWSAYDASPYAANPGAIINCALRDSSMREGRATFVRGPAPSVDPGVQPGVGDTWRVRCCSGGPQDVVITEFGFTGHCTCKEHVRWRCQNGHVNGWCAKSFIANAAFVRHGTPQEQRAEPPRPAPVKPADPYLGANVIQASKETGPGIQARTLPPARVPWVSDLDPDWWLPDAQEGWRR